MTDSNNGIVPEQATEEEVNEVVNELLGFVSIAFEQKVLDTIDVEEARKVVRQLLPQTMTLGRALLDVANPESVTSHPYWGFRLLDAKGELLGVTVVPKKVTKAKNAAEVMQYMATMLFAVHPLPHVLSTLLGLRIELFQTDKPPSGHSKLVI